MSYGWLIRAFETTDDPGTGFLDLDGAQSGYFSIVDAAKVASGTGTGPWSVEVVVTDVPNGGTDWELVVCNVEEGTGVGGRDRLRIDTGTIKKSTNADSPVNWGSNTKNVFGCPLPMKAGAFFDKISTNGVLKRSGSESYTVISDGFTGRLLIGASLASDARTTIEAVDRGLTEQTLLTTVGDLFYMNTGPAEARLPIGSADDFLRVVSGKPAWVALLASMSAFTNTTAKLPGSPTTVQTAIEKTQALPFSRSNQTNAMTNPWASPNTNTDVALTDLDNLTPPGSPDGALRYRVYGQVSCSGFTGNDNLYVKVHLGTLGTTSDAVIAVAYGVANNPTGTNCTVPIPMIDFVPGSTDKITISARSNSTVADVMIGTGETFVTIEQIRNV